MSMLKQQMAPLQTREEWAALDQRRFCLAGLYLLTRDAALARFDAAGDLTVDEALSEALSFRLQAVLDQYRSGAVDGLNLGLIADTGFEPQWSSGTLIFDDRVLGELFDTGRRADAPWATYQRRNKSKTVYQGMELLLSKNRRSEPVMPGFCPVLFVPEVDRETLRERYGVDFALDRGLLEVLDLSAPFAASSQAPPELASMVEDMRRAQREEAPSAVPEGPANPPGAQALSGVAADPISRYCVGAATDPPWDSCFNEGDAVTGWLLESFCPFHELTDTQRDIIAGYETIRKVKRGTRLIDQGSRDDICIYLVEGSLALTGLDNATMVVKAGTRRSRLPISVLTPHVYDVLAATDASIIVFSQRLVRRIIEITTTYTSVNPGQDSDESTAAISNGVQSLYLSRVPSRPEPTGCG